MTIITVHIIATSYRLAGKFHGGGEVWQIWRIICVSPNSNLYLQLITFSSIHLPNFFCQTLRKSTFAKQSLHQTFLLAIWYVFIKPIIFLSNKSTVLVHTYIFHTLAQPCVMSHVILLKLIELEWNNYTGAYIN